MTNIQIYISIYFGGRAMNEILTVHHKVKDYATWRTSYDGHEKSRLSAGITNGRVFCSPEDRNDVVVLQDVADVTQHPLRDLSSTNRL
jgi:hypothetical protein